MENHLEDRAEALWKVAYAKAKRPLSEIRVPDDEASRLAAEGVRAYVAARQSDAALAAACRWVEDHVRGAALAWVAERRLRTNEPNRFAVGEADNPRWDHVRLSDMDSDSSDWQKLYDQLRPVAFGLAKRWQRAPADAEDVFHDALADLTKVSPTTGETLLQRLTVAEEALPLFSTIVRRKLGRTRKPETSLDDDESAVQPEGATTGGVKFMEIYRHCQECVSAFGWELIFAIFLEGRSREELLGEDNVLQRLGLDGTAAKATKFRKLKDELTAGLENLGPCVRELLGQPMTLTLS